jgi:hypothetical protein
MTILPQRHKGHKAIRGIFILFTTKAQRAQSRKSLPVGRQVEVSMRGWARKTVYFGFYWENYKKSLIIEYQLLMRAQSSVFENVLSLIIL